MQTQQSRARIGLVQAAIIVMTLVTAFIHLYLSVLMGKFSLLFTLNALGYLSLLAALLLPLPLVRQRRSLVRILFILYTLVTIVGWVFSGSRIPIAYIDKLAEICLVILLWLDRSRNG
jgi:hypothetical protein